MNKLLELHQKLQNQEEHISQNRQENEHKIRALGHESQRLENVKNMRLQQLERVNPEAFRAVNWLRNNKHLFSGEIFEPIMLEVNILEDRYGKFVENVIPFRDRLAFTCVNKDDMNKLIRALRESQKLSVNIVHSEEAETNIYQPNVPIENIRRYGFFNYINNLFTAPAPIMNYLCKTYQLHNIPVGDQNVDSCYEQIPNEINQFFSEKYRYSIRYSKYSGQKSTRQVEVRGDGGLSLSLDVIRLNKLKSEISEIETTIERDVSKEQTLNQQAYKCTERIKLVRQKLKEFQQEKLNVQNIEKRIDSLRTNIVRMQNVKQNPATIEAEGREKIKNIIKNLYPVHDTFYKELTKLNVVEKEKALVAVKIEIDRKQVAYFENSLKDNQHQCLEAEETLNVIKDRCDDIMNKAKAMLMKAKEVSEGFTPLDVGFQQFKDEYERLPSDIQELNAFKEQIQSRIACLNIADDGELREYEERQQHIKNLTEQHETVSTEFNMLSSKMNRLQDEWLIPLGNLIRQINERFANIFDSMGCSGEISISTGDNEKDFSRYGISVKVTYRDGEPLQELNSNVQSGGERAVATAAYMLALQELTPVPFRCVDEINQGRFRALSLLFRETLPVPHVTFLSIILFFFVPV